jgi:hypothetical protein
MNEADILTMRDAEEAFMLLTSLYLSSNNEYRKLTRKRWDYNYAWKIPNQSRLACINGEKYSQQSRIEASLVYDSLEDAPLTREHLISLAIVYHSCLLAGIDPSTPFLKVAQASSQNVASRLLNFLHRHKDDLSLEAFMLRPHKDINNEWEIPWPR